MQVWFVIASLWVKVNIVLNSSSNLYNFIFILQTCALDTGHDKLTEGQQQEDDGGGDEVHCDVVPGKVDPRRLLHLVKTILILQEIPKPVWKLILGLEFYWSV